MSPEQRIITAAFARDKGIAAEPFPYFAATFSQDLTVPGEEDEGPIGEQYTSVEEETRRLASVDQQIFEKMRQAEVEAQEVARRAYEEGFSAGEQEGRAFGESQYRAYLQRLEGHLQELAASLQVLGRASEDELLALVLACAEYLSGREILAAADGAAPLLRAILAANPTLGASEEGPLTVLLNPRDMEMMGTTFEAPPGLLLAEDPDLSRGSLRLRAPDGILDATLERRRERLLRLVERWRAAEGAAGQEEGG